MADYRQANRQMIVTTPLGKDKLLLAGFEGEERISGLYAFQVELFAANSDSPSIKFDKILGQEITITVQIEEEDPESDSTTNRYFSGICRQFAQGTRDQDFTYYRAEIVPQLWLTTRIRQSRIFQQISVPDILKKVLAQYKVTYQLDGTYEKREYCVQYRETDFNFISRLMEEEGIFYFFKHTRNGHELVIADSGPAHPDVPGAHTVEYDTEEGGQTAERHIHEWVKLQEIRSGKYTLWDQSFHRPGDNFESKKNTLNSIPVGTVTHQLGVAGNDKLEIYDYPGDFAQRFDGIDKGGGEQSAELGKISPDGVRTVGLLMQAETLAGLVIEGRSNCSQFTTGHTFTLDKHFDAEGEYLLTSVHHTARNGSAYRSGGDGTYIYNNRFSCIPKDLPFRPQRTTPKPTVLGVQTAVVVGPQGEEIFTDKFGRVKVQFPWDREGNADANSSCWLRVGTSWAGKQWGAISIPRIGHEVIVQFIEGDPDEPIIIGSVYNAGSMPPYKLPDEKTKSTVKSNSSKGGQGFNEFRFEDKKGSEQIFVHGEKNLDIRVKNDRFETILHDRHLQVDNEKFEVVKVSRHEEVKKSHFEKIGEDRNVKIGGKEAIAVNGSQSVQVGSDVIYDIGGNLTEKVSGNIFLSANGDLVLESSSNVTIKVGGCYVAISPAGIAINGTMVKIN